MQRLIDILCHPRRIGIYNKDKIYIPFIYFLSFFLLFMGLVMIINFNTEYYSVETSGNIIYVIDVSNEDIYGDYHDGSFNFNNKKNDITTDDMIIYFNHNNVDTSINTINKTNAKAAPEIPFFWHPQFIYLSSFLSLHCYYKQNF